MSGPSGSPIENGVWTLGFMLSQIWPLLLPAVGLVLLGSFLISSTSSSTTGGSKTQLLWLLLLVVPCLFIVLLTSVSWPKPPTSANSASAYTLWLSALLEVVLAIYLMIRLKAYPLWAVMYGLLGIYTATLLAFVGAMAVSNSWL